MNKRTQVLSSHYDFSEYMSKKRWISLWYQLNEISNLNPDNVLEIGSGPGVFKNVGRSAGFRIDTMDIDENLKPEIVGTITDLPIADNSYDVVCAFQVLEHIPFKASIAAFQEMVRVSKKYILISLPNVKKAWPYSMHIPTKGVVDVFFERPFQIAKSHKYDGQHYWEINRLGFSFKKIVSEFTNENLILEKHYRIHENQYHHMFLFKKHD